MWPVQKQETTPEDATLLWLLYVQTLMGSAALSSRS